MQTDDRLTQSEISNSIKLGQRSAKSPISAKRIKIIFSFNILQFDRNIRLSANDFRHPAIFKRSNVFGVYRMNVSTLSVSNEVHEIFKFSNLKFFLECFNVFS